MNINKELRKMEGISNTVCRSNGTLEVFSNKDMKEIVIRWLNENNLQWSFTKVDFYNMSEW